MKFSKKLLIFFLGMIFGIMSMAGAIFGVGYWGYKNVTLDYVREKASIGEIQVLGRDGEADLNSMSISELITEFRTVYANRGELSLDDLIERYDLRIPAETLAYLPTSARTMPLSMIASRDVVNNVMERETVSYILQFLPEDVFSAELRSALADKPISMIRDRDFAGLLQGVRLGYLMGVAFDEAGNAVYADPEHPTVAELTASADMGALFSALNEGKGVVGFLREELGTVSLSDMAGGVADNNRLLQAITASKTIADLIVYNEEAAVYEIDMTGLTDGLRIGDVLGYYAQEEGTGGDLSLVWYTDEACTTPVSMKSPILKNLYALGLSDIQNSEDLLGDVLGENLALGELLGYEHDAENDQWSDGSGSRFGAVENAVYHLNVSELVNGDGSYRLTDVFEGLYIGDALGYNKGEQTNAGEAEQEPEYRWTKEDGTEVSGTENIIANLSVMSLVNGTVDTDGILDDMTIADMMDYTARSVQFYADAEDAAPISDTVYTLYFDKDGNRVQSVLGALAEGTIQTLPSDVDLLSVGACIGYYSCETAGVIHWYRIDSVTDDRAVVTEVSGLMTAFVGLTVSDMRNTETVRNKVKELTVADVLGYRLTEDGYVDADGAPLTGIMKSLAAKQVGGLQSAVDDIRLGDIFGYEYRDGTWYDGEQAAIGVTAALSDSTVATVKDDINDVAIGSVFGYRLEGGVWYDGETKATGITAALADSTIGEIGSDIQTLKLGSVFGYTYDGATWWNGTEEATGITAAFASLTVNEMSDPARVSEVVQSIPLGDALGYTKSGAVWVDVEGHEVTGILAIIGCDTPVGQVGSSADRFAGSGVGVLLDAGVVTLSASTQTRLDVIFAADGGRNYWRSLTMQELLDEIIGKVPTV